VIQIADLSVHPELAALDRDFWLFDADGPQPFAALMSYDQAGNYLGSEITAASEVIGHCRARRRLAERFAVPLDSYLAHLRAA